ncbi:uncharacterized protein J3R85_020449 [Psidium guajava]|nr:uncharacterized protein J3R85_020449 [Psidium guajava]
MPSVQLRKSFEICISLLNHILSLLLNSKLNNGFLDLSCYQTMLRKQLDASSLILH